ncbi:hypothetical protein FACS189429_1550 [Bacteroidia bacterium]|nr:hypothetical protein FACS189429_1550 [Bacteroidia bacterium]GHV43997.1 hypothetical protein FACS1894180_4680 [Bacteroidia bacterium]
MNKTIFILIFTLFICVNSVSAQFGISAGYTIGNINYDGKQNMNGFQAGISYDFHIQNEWYIYSGLSYSQFGRSNTVQKPLGKWQYAYSHGFLEIPIHATFVMEVLDDLNLFVSAGPKLSYALFGTETLKKPDGSTNKIKFYDNNVSPFNVLAGFNLGAQYYKLRLKIGYDWGLLNQYSGMDSKMYNRGGFVVSLGYVF